LVRVLAVNNYPTTDRFERLQKCLEENGAEVSVADWTGISARAFDGFDGVVLSGSPDMLSRASTRKKYAPEIAAIGEAKTPVLGVCFGHQLMAVAFGANVIEDGRPVLDFVKTEVLEEDSLFRGLPKTLTLLESRHEVVQSLPDGFSLLARSETSPIATMKHRKRPLYGVQFHPERWTTKNPDGNQVVANFVNLLT
jgi:GMP synthase (glutamine-hydrolysing)